MSSMISLMNAVLAWGDLPLLDNASFTINSGDRIGLIGRNGIGKSSLLSVMAQRNALDGGEMKVQDGLRIAFVEQEPVFPKAGSLKESLIIRGKLSELPDDAEKWSRISCLMNPPIISTSTASSVLKNSFSRNTEDNARS